MNPFYGMDLDSRCLLQALCGKCCSLLHCVGCRFHSQISNIGLAYAMNAIQSIGAPNKAFLIPLSQWRLLAVANVISVGRQFTEKEPRNVMLIRVKPRDRGKIICLEMGLWPPDCILFLKHLMAFNVWKCASYVFRGKSDSMVVDRTYQLEVPVP
jgi:hypothetical protein